MLNSFTELNLDPAIARGISDMGFVEPTPIQRAALPPALAGRDVLAGAMTGSGKTAAFALPILQRLAGRRDRAVRALVLTPTRELAAQVHEHFEALGRHTSVRSAAIFGGVKPGPQEKALRSGVEVVVATPGRLLDLMQYPWARFDQLEVLVLDEADRMLDMGFLPDIRRILGKLPGKRQNLLFSATLPRPIVELSRNLLNDPARIDVERRPDPPTGITQSVLPVAEALKPTLLLELLERGDIKTALVFTRTKHRANRLADKLMRAGIGATGSTATAANGSERRLWPPSRTAVSRCWLRPTSPPEASTFTSCRTWSTSTFRASLRTTSIASGAPRVPAPRATPLRSCLRPRCRRSRPSSGRWAASSIAATCRASITGPSRRADSRFRLPSELPLTEPKRPGRGRGSGPPIPGPGAAASLGDRVANEKIQARNR